MEDELEKKITRLEEKMKLEGIKRKSQLVEPMLINIHLHNISKKSLKLLAKLPFVKGILKTQKCYIFLCFRGASGIFQS